MSDQAYLWPDGYHRTTPPDPSTEEYRRWMENIVAERDRLREALEWYEKIVGDCNRRGREGDDARNAIAQDMGKRARTALKEDRDG